MIQGSIENVAYHGETSVAQKNDGVNTAANNTASDPCLVATDSQVSTLNGTKMVSKANEQQEMLLIETESARYKIAQFHDEKIKEHLLDAVRRRSYDVVVTLFDGLDANGEAQLLRGGAERAVAGWNWREFPPLIMAAQQGQYDIVRFLLAKGFTIEPPHDVQCSCDICHIDYLRTSQERLSLYKALANPIWMTLTSDDPILTAFKMSTKMKELANQEDEFEKEYTALFKTCKQFAVGLLNECCDSKEQETILHHSHEEHCQTSGGDKRLDLLKTAISMEQKEFVAHTFSQHLLMSLIFKVAKRWRNSNLPYKILYVISRVLMFPFMACAYILFPCCSFSQTMKEPLIKFINHTIAFISFLLLLAISSTQTLNIRHGRVPSGIEFLIIFYVLGLAWSECKQLWSEGMWRYLSSGWNWMDLTMLLMLFGAFVIWATTAAVGAIRGRGYDQHIRMSVSVADGLYAMGIIMSFFRLIYLCQISRYLGLLQLCLSRMVRVILQFAFISWVVLWSFSIGMHMLYTSSKNFPGKNQTLLRNEKIQEESRDGGFMALSWHGNYNSLIKSAIAMAWASLNMIELKSLSVFDNSNMIQFWSGALFTIYHASSMIVLLNMLIAMMANSYQQIEDNIEVEYKFARAQMWVEYFDDVATLPSPFNIIPTPKTISRIFSLIIERVCGKSWTISYHGKRSFSLHRAGTYNNSERKKCYLELCQQLVKRYLARKTLDLLQKDADNGMIHAIELSKAEIRQTLEEMKQMIKLHTKT